MVAKITVGTSLYGALAYNGMKVNEGEGKLLAVNKVFDDGSGRVDIARAEQDFKRYMPENVRTRNKVIHISLNPHPDDRLTDMEMEQLAREYLEKLGYGDQPYLIFKHEDINRHHLHIVSVNVDEHGRRLNKDFIHRRSKRITTELEKKYGLHPADRRQHRHDNPLCKVDASQGDVKRQVANTVPCYPSTMSRWRKHVAWRADGNITGWSIPPPMMSGTRWAILSRHPVSGSPSATRPCGTGLNTPRPTSATSVRRT